jgi:HEAT repeat protein
VEALQYFDRPIVEQSLVVRPSLIQALQSPDARARAAAVKGLGLSDIGRGAHDPTLFPTFASLLHDPSPDVRHHASVVVGAYGGQPALDALRSAVTDPDGDVGEQATIAVGWVATKAAIGSETHRQAVEWLMKLADSGSSRVARQAAE